MDLRVYLTVMATIAWVLILVGAVIRLRCAGGQATAWLEVTGVGLVAVVSCVALLIEPPLGLVGPEETVNRRVYYPGWLDVWMRWKYVPVYAGYVLFAVGYLAGSVNKTRGKS